eukprot:scaffold22147_cov107-Skeletonema_marinoi.AAC.1
MPTNYYAANAKIEELVGWESGIAVSLAGRLEKMCGSQPPPASTALRPFPLFWKAMEGNQKKLHPLEHGVYNDTCYNDLQGGIRSGSWVDLVDKLWLFHGHFLTTISVKNEIRRPRADELWRGARAVIAMQCIIKLAVDLR